MRPKNFPRKNLNRLMSVNQSLGTRECIARYGMIDRHRSNTYEIAWEFFWPNFRGKGLTTTYHGRHLPLMPCLHGPSPSWKSTWEPQRRWTIPVWRHPPNDKKNLQQTLNELVKVVDRGRGMMGRENGGPDMVESIGRARNSHKRWRLRKRERVGKMGKLTPSPTPLSVLFRSTWSYVQLGARTVWRLTLRIRSLNKNQVQRSEPAAEHPECSPNSLAPEVAEKHFDFERQPTGSVAE